MTFSFAATAVQTFLRETREKGYPAVHHSTAYKEQYAPAYRVILKEFAPSLE